MFGKEKLAAAAMTRDDGCHDNSLVRSALAKPASHVDDGGVSTWWIMGGSRIVEM
jgi:hypothetical protein